MAENKIKQLRDFIKKHEMRYFVDYQSYCGQTHIKKAFKVEINKEDVWVHFSYGDRPYILNQNEVRYNLFASMDDAKAKAEKLREAHKKKKAEKDKQKKEKFNEVTEYLENFRMYDLRTGYGDDAEIKPEGKKFAQAIKYLYNDIPKKDQWETSADLIKLLTNYIKTGTFYTQGISFRKEHVVYVKHGKGNAVEIELTNGTKIRPVSSNFCFLINTVFNSDDHWEYNFIEPKGTHDDIKEANR